MNGGKLQQNDQYHQLKVIISQYAGMCITNLYITIFILLV